MRAASRSLVLQSPALPLHAPSRQACRRRPNAADAMGSSLPRAYQKSKQLLSEVMPGWVVVSDAFRLLAEKSFQLEPLGTGSVISAGA